MASVTALYVGKGIRLSINQQASESFCWDYIHLPRTLANKPFLKLEEHQATIETKVRTMVWWQRQKESQLHRFLDLEKEYCWKGERNISHILPQSRRVIYGSKNEKPTPKKEKNNSNYSIVSGGEQTVCSPVSSIFHESEINLAHSFNSWNDSTITSPCGKSSIRTQHWPHIEKDWPARAYWNSSWILLRIKSVIFVGQTRLQRFSDCVRLERATFWVIS